MSRQTNFLTADNILNSQLLRCSFFQPQQAWLIAPRGVFYRNWLLIPIQHQQGWILEAHSPTFGICIDSTIYRTPEEAIDNGPEFVSRWFAQYSLLDVS